MHDIRTTGKIVAFFEVRSVAGLVMQASGNLVEVDILELSRFPCRGVGICQTSIGLVLMMEGNIPEADTGNG